MGAFTLSIFSDEISHDFEHALRVATQDFGLDHVELRSAWGKNILRWNAKEVADARGLLEKYRVRVTSIAGPLFKVDWPGAPVSAHSPQRDQFGAEFTFEEQPEVLERSIRLAQAFRTERVRCFDFWRLDDQAPYRAAMDRLLQDAAETCGRHGLRLVMENEPACNTATSTEAARTLAHVPSKAYALNWDPGNSEFGGEPPFPGGYAKLPKKRIGHVHVKDARRNAAGVWEWQAMGTGVVDFVGLFRALMRDGYRGAIVLETHWRGAGSAEASSRKSLEGLRVQLREAGAL